MESFLLRTLLSIPVTWLWCLLLAESATNLPRRPMFDAPTANITVKEKATAILPCSIKYLGKHQVIWTDQFSTLLTHEERRIIDDNRLSVERPFVKDWNLHIRDVQYEDQGLYNCQINTNPVMIKVVTLKVFVPPKISNNVTTDTVIAREGDTVTLMCNVSGIPPPTVTWHRLTNDEKGERQQSEFCPGTNKVGMNGEVLIIYNISRHCGDTYVCLASNGVPPEKKMFISVSVQFPPEVNLPNTRIGQDLGKETILECQITANPQVEGHWLKDGHEMKTLSGRYRVEAYEEDTFTYTLTLRILYILDEDFGMYTCRATNSLGTDTDSMTLYNYSQYRPRPVATTTPIPTLRVEHTPMPMRPVTSTHLAYSPRPPVQQPYNQAHWTDRPMTNLVNRNHRPYGTKRPHTVLVDSDTPNAGNSRENRARIAAISLPLAVLCFITSTVLSLKSTWSSSP